MKILVISHWAPPEIRPQSILIEKLLKGFSRQGIEGDLMSVSPVNNVGGFSNIRLSAKKNRIKNLLVLLGKNIFLNAASSDDARTIVKLDFSKYQLIFSFANPQISNLLGMKLKKISGLPWIAHFSDPWSNHPYKKFGFIKKLVVQKQERMIIEKSDAVVFVSDELRDFVMSRYPGSLRDKTYVIPHCFDPELYPDKVSKDSGRFIFRYVGSFYKERNPLSLFEALASIYKDQPELLNNTLIEFVGSSMEYSGSVDVRRYLNRNHQELKDICRFVPPVDYKKGLELMAGADVLINIDAKYENSPFLPSKLIDYIGSGTRILNITTRNSATWKVVDKLENGINVEIEGVQNVVEVLKNILTHTDEWRTKAKPLNEYGIMGIMLLWHNLFKKNNK